MFRFKLMSNSNSDFERTYCNPEVVNKRNLISVLQNFQDVKFYPIERDNFKSCMNVQFCSVAVS